MNQHEQESHDEAAANAQIEYDQRHANVHPAFRSALNAACPAPANDQFTESENAAIARIEALQVKFEAWANSHGDIDLTKHDGFANERDDFFPATYWSEKTEIAWRAVANIRTAVIVKKGGAQ